MSQGYLSLILHAHLPFVRHVGDSAPQRDDWFHEALVESYIPLCRSWHRLLAEGVPFRLTLSLSPTLISMLSDPWLQEQASLRLNQLVELGEKEMERTRPRPEEHAVARMYYERFSAARDFLVKDWQGNLLEAIRPLIQAGRLQVITCAATHGFLPGLRANDNAVRAQIMVALDRYADEFGKRPQGFWLPECAYYDGVDQILQAEGIRYFITDSVALEKGRPKPKFGVHAPVYTRAGVAAFARDPIASEQVWSSMVGYPGDVDYREFYRDIGYDLDYQYLAPYLPPDGTRKDTTFKYHRITGPGGDKKVYVREWALSKAGSHSRHFLETCTGRVAQMAGQLDRKPIIVAPFDAELFGHWWFEGPEWLDFLIRKMAFDQQAIDLVTPADYLNQYPVNQVVELCPSTWGRKATNEVWINGKNDYVYRHLHWAGQQMRRLGREAAPEGEIFDRARRQAARELLLAQASDWTFMMDDANTAPYGHGRFREHMLNFIGLCRQIRDGHADGEWLARLEHQDNLFPDVNLAHFT